MSEAAFAGRFIFVFSADEISQIIDPQKKDASNKKDRAKSKSGYFGILQTGIGYATYGGVDFTFGMINGYKFNPWLFLGLGIDFGTTAKYQTDYGDHQGIILPIYLHFRYSLLGGRPNNNVSPYIAFNSGIDPFGGYNISLYYGFSAGIQIKNIKKGYLWIGVDVPFHHSLGDDHLFTSSCDLCFKVGWSF